MLKISCARLYGALVAVCLTMTAPAYAQFTPRTLNDPATGEKFHIEGAAGFWSPNADMSISSESLGIPGSTIDFKKDLGLTDQRFPELHLVLRPGIKHKLRLQYIPIKYEQTHAIPQSITFNGLRYPINTPVNSSIEWKAYRLGYEYDFITRNRGFGGFILDVKYTEVNTSLLVSVPPIQGFAHAKAPIPAIGGIARVYVVPNISITGEVTGVKIPDSVSKEFKAHYADVDIYGTVNLTNNVGVMGGYRSFDVGYHFDKDDGAFVLQGIYFGVVARY